MFIDKLEVTDNFSQQVRLEAFRAAVTLAVSTQRSGPAATNKYIIDTTREFIALLLETNQ